MSEEAVYQESLNLLNLNLNLIKNSLISLILDWKLLLDNSLDTELDFQHLLDLDFNLLIENTFGH